MIDSSNNVRRLPRILLIENSLHTTGAFNAAIGLINALDSDYEIELVLPAASTLSQKFQASGTYCHILPMSELSRSWVRLLSYPFLLLFNVVSLRRLMSLRKIDVLVMNDYYNLLGVMARCSGWRGQLIIMVRLMPFKQHPVLNRIWTYLSLRFADKVIAVSQAVSNQLPVSDKVKVLYDPISFEERHPVVSASKNIDVISCLYLANYIEGKGHLHGLQAFALAFSQNPALRLRYVGGDMGLEKNRALKASLENAIASMGLGDVVICDGFSNDVELDIKQADIVLNFSESESFSYTCLEACAYGRPIIATRCGGPEEIVIDKVSGLLIPVGDIQSMGTALLLLSNDHEKRELMGAAGRRIVHERFSKQRFANGWRKIISIKT